MSTTLPRVRGHVFRKARLVLTGAIVASLTTGSGKALAADVTSEEAFVRQIRDLMVDPESSGDQRADMESLASRRDKVIRAVDAMLKAYPKTRLHDEVMMARLDSLRIITFIRALPLDGLLTEADRVLAGNPSPDLAASAAYLKIQAQLAAHRAQTRRQTATTQPGATSRGTLSAAELAKQRRKFAVDLYLGYIARYPRSPWAPPMLAALVEDAWDRNDSVAADRFLSMLVEGFPHHVESERIKGAKKRRNAIGRPFELSFISTAGQEVSVQRMTGQIVVVAFWATWCQPCRQALPRLKALYDRLQSRGVRVIGISLDSSRQALDECVRKERIAWPQYFDGKQWENDIARQFGVDAIPAVYVVDRRGLLRAISPPNLEALVEQLVNEPVK
jgi:peroxiredoxin